MTVNVRLPAQSRRTALSLWFGMVLMGLTEAIFVSDSRGGLFLNHILIFAFVLVAVEGSSGEDAAAALGIPLNTLWTRLHHARREFLERMEALGGNEEDVP